MEDGTVTVRHRDTMRQERVHQYTELSGVKVNLFQAAELAKLMGVKIV